MQSHEIIEGDGNLNIVYEKEKELVQINDMRIKTLERILQDKVIIIQN
jgi:hypothetical protein